MLHRTAQLSECSLRASGLDFDGAVVAVEDVAGEVEGAGGGAHEPAEPDALYGAVRTEAEARFGFCSGLFHVKHPGSWAGGCFTWNITV